MPTPLIETPSQPGKSILVTGKKRDGKSWYVFNRIFLQFNGPAIYVDPKGADPYIRGEIRRTVDDVKAHPANKIVFQIRPGDSVEKFDEEVAKLFEYVVQWKRGYPHVPFLIVIDESYRYMSKFQMEEGPNTLVQTCSALDISTIIINPDYSTVPRILYMQSDYIIFFTAHPTIKMYLEDRLTMEIPDVVWKHVSRNQTDVMSKKGYGMMLDWSDRIWLIFPDGHMDCVQGGEKDESDNEDSGNPDAESGDGRELDPKPADGAPAPAKPVPDNANRGAGAQ